MTIGVVACGGNDGGRKREIREMEEEDREENEMVVARGGGYDKVYGEKRGEKGLCVLRSLRGVQRSFK